jgi:hypothetical protein
LDEERGHRKGGMRYEEEEERRNQSGINHKLCKEN